VSAIIAFILTQEGAITAAAGRDRGEEQLTQLNVVYLWPLFHSHTLNLLYVFSLSMQKKKWPNFSFFLLLSNSFCRALEKTKGKIPGCSALDLKLKCLLVGILWRFIVV
jgi:hypothetical protein